MNLDQYLKSWTRRIRALLEAEIPVQPTTMHLTESGSLLEEAEQTGASPSLSVALLQLGLIHHLPEAFPVGSPASSSAGKRYLSPFE